MTLLASIHELTVPLYLLTCIDRRAVVFYAKRRRRISCGNGSECNRELWRPMRQDGHGVVSCPASVGNASHAGVVLHSPIMSGMRVLTDSRALSCLDIYPNVDRMARVRCPVMVMHGMKDEEVSADTGWNRSVGSWIRRIVDPLGLRSVESSVRWVSDPLGQVTAWGWC